MIIFKIDRFDQLSVKTFFDLIRLRINVFVTEQKITAPELDDQDLKSWHAYLQDTKNQHIVAVCRLFYDDAHHLYIGRVAVNQKKRGLHLGSELMTNVHSFIQENHLASKLYLHAQAPVIPFYEQLGYKAIGPRFMEAGIEHQLMIKEL